MKVALYATYSPTSEASSMVLRQISQVHMAGYDVMVICNSKHVDPCLEVGATWILHRPHDAGFDFGGWKDAFYENPWLVYAQEILLMNDSMLGPLVPLMPIIEQMRRRPDEVCGLTDCHLYSHHLQNYIALFKSERAIHTLAQFLAELPPLPTKADAIRDGEIAMSRYLVQHGITIGVEWGYTEVLEKVIAADPDWIHAIVGERDVRKITLNGIYNLWLPLIRLGFPFVKRNLVVSNPTRSPGIAYIEHWWKRHTVSTPWSEVEEHLRIFRVDSTKS